jgi:endonuclease/exonuclease/phosphatase family metal-dependent hydrolase
MSHGRIMRTIRSWKKTGRKNRLKATTLHVGTPLLFNRRAPFRIAPRSFAKIGKSLTRTLRIDVTSCIPLKGKERQERDLPLFFSLKAPKAKEKAMERAKANRAKAKVCETRVAKGNNLRVRNAHLRTRATSASKPDTTKLNASSVRP